jgi:hypothetical protein
MSDSRISDSSARVRGQRVGGEDEEDEGAATREADGGWRPAKRMRVRSLSSWRRYWERVRILLEVQGLEGSEVERWDARIRASSLDARSGGLRRRARVAVSRGESNGVDSRVGWGDGKGLIWVGVRRPSDSDSHSRSSDVLVVVDMDTTLVVSSKSSSRGGR